MDTQLIFDELKGQFGDAAARSLTRTFAAVQTHSDAKMTEQAEVQARSDVKFAELADGQKRLFEAQARTEVKVTELADAQADTATALQRLTIRTDSVVGRTLELQFRDRIASYLELFMRRCRLVDTAKLVDALEPHLDRRELADVIRADAIASGVIDGRPSHVVVEVSAAADVEDIQRACRRAGFLRRAGPDAVPIIACEVISPESRAYSKQNEVLVWLDGRMLDSGEAA